MTFADWVAVSVVSLVIVLAVVYIIKAKRKGVKCIGCPHAQSCCSHKNDGCDRK